MTAAGSAADTRSAEDAAERTRVAATARHRRVTQTSGLVVGRVLASVISFAWMIVLARTLSPGAVGTLALGMTLALALNVLADLGIPMIVSDRVARHPEDTRSLVARADRIRLLASVFTGVVLVVMFRLASDGTLAVPVFLAVSIAATAVYTTSTAALRGLGWVYPDVLNEVLSRIFVFAAGGVALWLGHGIGVAAAVLALADVLSAIVLTQVVRSRAPARHPFPSQLVSWRAILPLAVALLVGSLHTRINVWLLALMETSSTVAHYAVPARIAEGLLIPAGAAAALVLPLTASADSERARGRIAFRYVAAVTALVAVGAAVVAVLAPTLLGLAFGDEYRGDADLLRVLCLTAVPAAVSVGLSPLVAILRRILLFRWVLAGLVVNVVACLLLIPGMQELGAAWASAISMTIVATGMVITVARLRPTLLGPVG